MDAAPTEEATAGQLEPLPSQAKFDIFLRQIEEATANNTKPDFFGYDAVRHTIPHVACLQRQLNALSVEFKTQIRERSEEMNQLTGNKIAALGFQKQQEA